LRASRTQVTEITEHFSPSLPCAEGLAAVQIIQAPDSAHAKLLHRLMHFLTYSYHQRM